MDCRAQVKWVRGRSLAFRLPTAVARQWVPHDVRGCGLFDCKDETEEAELR